MERNRNSRRKGLNFEFDSEDSEDSVEETNAHKKRATLNSKESNLPHENDQPKKIETSASIATENENGIVGTSCTGLSTESNKELEPSIAYSIKCILHPNKEGRDHGVIKPFVENFESWDRVKECAEARSKAQKLSKYSDIIKDLPSVFTREHGYHSDCYKKFTAFKKGDLVIDTDDSISSTRSKIVSPRIDPMKKDILPEVCLFCGLKRKKHKQKWMDLTSCEYTKTEVNIRKAAKYFDDKEILFKIGNYNYGEGPDFTAMEVKYHHQPCKMEYLNKWQKLVKSDTNEKSIDTLAKEAAKKSIVQYVNDFVLKKGNPILINETLDKFKKMFIAHGGSAEEIMSYNVQNLSNFLKKKLPALEICTDSTKKSIGFKSGSMTPSLARECVKSNTNDDNVIWECAMKLRQQILNSEPQPLEEPLTVDAIMKGEAQIPDSVRNFFKLLYTGGNDEVSKRKQRVIDSSAADAVFSSTGGRLIPGKHLALGLALKSMTGSKTVTKLVNRLGHCVSNEKVRQVDIGLESTINITNSLKPENIVRDSTSCIGLAWDNFDIILETLSGSDSIHHTYGICYQNNNDDIDLGLSELPATDAVRRKVRDISKGNALSSEETIQPYKKKPLMNKFHFYEANVLCPENYLTYLSLDTLWCLSFNSFGNVAMWTGWNTEFHTQFSKQSQLKQTIGYMKPIMLPPTRNDVVLETLNRSKELANECDSSCIVVTYDLAIAKIAKQIQCTEHPEFDDIFIQFGQFHTELNIFSALGKSSKILVLHTYS